MSERTDTERLQELAEASRVIQERFEDGTFIRNISRDHEDGWVRRALNMTNELKRWVDATDAALDAEQRDREPAA